MNYNIELSPKADQKLGEIFEYFKLKINNTGNPIIAQKFANDYREILDLLKGYADSFIFADSESLRSKGIHKIHFRHLNYKIFYHIIDNTVIIDIICHDKEDYTKFFE